MHTNYKLTESEESLITSTIQLCEHHILKHKPTLESNLHSSTLSLQLTKSFARLHGWKAAEVGTDLCGRHGKLKLDSGVKSDEA